MQKRFCTCVYVCLSNYKKGNELLDLYLPSAPVRFGSGSPFSSHRLDSAHKHPFCTVICNLYQTTHLSENGGNISPAFPTNTSCSDPRGCRGTSASCSAIGQKWCFFTCLILVEGLWGNCSFCQSVLKASVSTGRGLIQDRKLSPLTSVPNE